MIIVVDKDDGWDDEWWLLMIVFDGDNDWGWLRWWMMIVVDEDDDWDDEWWLLLMEMMVEMMNDNCCWWR